MYRIYLDNCCFNRPYDDQVQQRIVFETQAKLYIQEQILNKNIELIWSYILKFENSRNLSNAIRNAIEQWENLSILFVEKTDKIVEKAKNIMTTGIHAADALHIACAIAGGCQYFLTVDKRLLKYTDENIIICNPIEFFNIITE
ncbi:MAG: PIN domain-containing protein [Prevotellaceae bacterium]|jgi:predicted nucleic acid-binding protein|nr:PIN domain-containing protein [Prevotellaceae bacterium]